MTILLADAALAGRAALAGKAFEPLAASLSEDLRRVMERPLYVPEQKALLSREGGRCADDGTMLDFDPFTPREHRCPRCGRVYEGVLHDRFWVYWYQLWLAERAVHGAVLGRLGVEPRATAFASSVLDAYCDLYPRYPNVDNVLGPTRPFFSTYLESIWLLQLCIAADLVGGKTADRFRDVVAGPSRALILSYDEGASNRQVWNNAALMASALLLGRSDAAESIVWADSGVASQLGSALLEDGTWYEGENYHLFAHRGLWYTMEMCAAAGFEVPGDLVERYERGFVTPFLTALPDLTFPSRRDSQYAISLRQWRFAELCELGRARRPDRLLDGMLSRLYAGDVERRDAGRWKSTAEAERNLPPTALSRGDLGWKSLLFADPSAPVGKASPGSTLLEAQGLGVLRRDNGRVYVALDYGVSGGGHGHPDRLNLVVMDGDRRILDDMGTGSYVDPSLHWYRSTLAHNAPMFGGQSQRRVDGALVAYEDRGAAGWIVGAAAIAPRAAARRQVVVMDDYLVDEVEWNGEAPLFDLPIHVDASPAGPGPRGAAELEGSGALEDGFRFLRDATLLATIPASETLHLSGTGVDLWLAADSSLQVWRAVGPGAPGRPDAPMLIVRAHERTGTLRSVLSWRGKVSAARLFPNPVVESGVERHEHARAVHGWNIVINVGSARSSIDLEGLEPEQLVGGDVYEGSMRDREPELEPRPLTPGQTLRSVLGEKSYRRSEQSWEEAGSPTAEIVGSNDNGRFRLKATVHAERSFVPPGTANHLDNEQADINGAGLQLYLRSNDKTAGYVIVPIADANSISVRPIDGWGSGIPIEGSWRPIADGYEIELLVEPPTPVLGIDLIVNEKPMGRERRRGQLLLSAEQNGFVYLRGDRHQASFTTLRLDRE